MTAFDRLPDSVLHSISILSSHLPPSLDLACIPRRYNRLLTYSRVCRAFARVAQQLLFKHLDFATAAAVNEFCAVVDSSPNARRLAFFTSTSMRISPTPEGLDEKATITSGQLDALFRRTPGVVELHLEYSWCDPLALSYLAGLRRLHLINTALACIAPAKHSHGQVSLPMEKEAESWYLPQLTHLSLNIVVFRDEDRKKILLRQLLNPTSLPSLRSLAVTWTAHTSKPDFHLVAPQLTHLWLQRKLVARPKGYSYNCRDAPAFPDADLACCTSQLKHLAIDLRDRSELDDLRAIGTATVSSNGTSSQPIPPISLRTLRLSSPYLTTAERVILSADLPSLASLHALLVSDVSDLPADRVLAHAKQRETVKQHCAALGVAVYGRDFQGEDVDEYDDKDEGQYARHERQEKQWGVLCEFVDNRARRRVAGG
ncbi:hypothetical protein JCM8097_002259 [Rhodosporidiobolus ruineniae]